MDILDAVAERPEETSPKKRAWFAPQLIAVDMAAITLSNADNVVDGPVDNHS
jgi:hypothetical protein